MKYARWALLMVALVGLMGSLGYIAFTPDGPAPVAAFPTLVAADLQGDEMRFADLAGEILVVDFWGTWCIPCLGEIPPLNALHADYAAEGVHLIGITFESGTAADILEWIAADPARRIDYPLVMSNDALQEAFGPIYGFPTTLLIDRDGTIIKRWIGAPPNKSDQLRELLDKMLAGEPLGDDHDAHQD